MEFDFKPSFDHKWDTPAQNEVCPSQPQPVQAAPKAVIETFDVDNAFANYKPNFKTTVTKSEIEMPEPVPAIDTLKGTVAEEIFGKFCQEKFGFKLDLTKQ
ncbi:hypothetical protein TVAG_319550 [Trichomonas vaginalis G3]|uniref:Uncharacterized protein n=1 Tax=Trichomonas vaginalis (strain ATCC PRA-98 / G3) TaxID=412133 RepID=A2DQA3_TRIV3|nr:hypothetical protein TVAGG3_1009340 [Trichomonas vaginalis G3]EAY17360.1 hypothetical protein TVAG_319550 [Trichomonas vaginalis G3]KAI5491368.1 hypothetical protein TVAGG3_1009340 [Trichomonas vaginalis G3]|eukprot:XP_001330729.1 hypothetical protein [Trichomonas vaginalis G3]